MIDWKVAERVLTAYRHLEIGVPEAVEMLERRIKDENYIIPRASQGYESLKAALTTVLIEYARQMGAGPGNLAGHTMEAVCRAFPGGERHCEQVSAQVEVTLTADGVECVLEQLQAENLAVHKGLLHPAEYALSRWGENWNIQKPIRMRFWEFLYYIGPGVGPASRFVGCQLYRDLTFFRD